MLRSTTADDVEDDGTDKDDEYCEERVAEENCLLEELRNFFPDHAPALFCSYTATCDKRWDQIVPSDKIPYIKIVGFSFEESRRIDYKN